MAAAVAITDRIRGGLLGLAVGDALGAPLEFLARSEIRAMGVQTEIVGGGILGWRPGQGTDDTDLAYAVVRAYVDGYSLDRVAERFLAWWSDHPRDVGRATAEALARLWRSRDPRGSGCRPGAAGNGTLMRAIATGLARPDAGRRRREAAEIAAVTHTDPRCVGASVAYCDLVDALLEGVPAAEAVERVLRDTPTGDAEVTATIERAAGGRGLAADRLVSSGFVLDTLHVAIWALLQPAPFEATLVEVVNLGDDADTAGAVAGGLLGVRDGAAAIPARWIERLEYRDKLEACVGPLAELRARAER
jgi:ADP-ribosyl-[dinitrogen reductase] hydrolase